MGNKESKRSNFIVQGGILAMAGIISRIIGLLYRMPLQRTIGDEGMGYYSAAFQIYSIMLIISSYSLPTAVSKLVAARTAKGQYRNARRIYRGAMLFSLISGGATCLVVLFGADWLAGTVMSLEKSAIALRVLAPTLLIVAFMGVIRGFFQGTGTMFPTAVSQLVEQLINAIVSVVAAISLFDYGSRVARILRNDSFAAAYGAAGGTLGTGAGALSGLIVLAVMLISHNALMRRRIRKDQNRNLESYGKIFAALFVTILPIILSTTIYNISDAIDQGLFNYIMDGKGFSDMKAAWWGIYSTKYKVLTNVPVALASAVCSSMMPSLTTCIEREEYKAARHKVSTAMRFTMILAIPCAMGLTVLGKPIIAMLFTGEVDLPANLLRMGSIAVILYSMSTLSNGILQGIDKMNIPVINAAIALVIHLLVLYLTLQVFDWKLYGVVVSCITFGLVMCILNWMSIRKHLRYKQEIGKTFVIPLIAASIMGLVCFGAYFGLSKLLSNMVSVLVAIIIGAIVYFIVLVKMGGVKENEIRSFPGGGFFVTIGKIMHIL